MHKNNYNHLIWYQEKLATRHRLCENNKLRSRLANELLKINQEILGNCLVEDSSKISLEKLFENEKQKRSSLRLFSEFGQRESLRR